MQCACGSHSRHLLDCRAVSSDGPQSARATLSMGRLKKYKVGRAENHPGRQQSRRIPAWKRSRENRGIEVEVKA